ncbi:MAG: hypothetical protein ACN4GW_10570 [Desulforhopalus sp.]
MYLSPFQLAAPQVRRPSSPAGVETLLEQGSGEFNEDVLLEHGNLYGVFDGATSLDRRRFDGGVTGGLLAARIAAESFLEEGASLHHLAGRANEHIRIAELNAGISLGERHKLWSTSMAVVRLDTDCFEYCQVGDAVILLLLRDGGYRFVTPEIDVDKQTLRLWKDSTNDPKLPVHKLLADQIRDVRLQMNISYGVLNGEPEALDFVNHGTHTLHNVSDILLFTDGLLPPREDPLEENDWSTLIALYKLGGLGSVREFVRRMQKSDQTLKRYPRFKMHDDIAAVAIKKYHLPQMAVVA